MSILSIYQSLPTWAHAINDMIIIQGFRRILYTPDKVAQIITSCKERLMKENVITQPFSVTEIQGVILKKYLIEDYLASHKVNLSKSQMVANNNFPSVLLHWQT